MSQNKGGLSFLQKLLTPSTYRQHINQ
jgi:hypothetical protein